MHNLRPEATRDDVGKAIDRVGSERIAFKDYIPYISIPLAWSERKGENRAKNIRRVRSLSSGYFVSQSYINITISEAQKRSTYLSHNRNYGKDAYLAGEFTTPSQSHHRDK